MTRARTLWTCLLVTTLVVGAGVLLSSGGAPERPSPVASPALTSGVGDEQRALGVLREWDARRSRAWAAGDRAALADLYVVGSAAGRRDRRMLAAWTQRGLRVRGLRTQLLAVHVRREGPRRLVLRVSDRVVGGVATGRGRRLLLPRDSVTRHVVGLRLVSGEWRVDEVRAAGWAGPQTRAERRIARTPRSRHS